LVDYFVGTILYPPLSRDEEAGKKFHLTADQAPEFELVIKIEEPEEIICWESRSSTQFFGRKAVNVLQSQLFQALESCQSKIM